MLRQTNCRIVRILNVAVCGELRAQAAKRAEGALKPHNSSPAQLGSAGADEPAEQAGAGSPAAAPVRSTASDPALGTSKQWLQAVAAAGGIRASSRPR